MLIYFNKFERVLYLALLLLLAVVLVASVIDLGNKVFTYLFDSSFPLLENNDILSIFSLFLLVLIGIEFFETILAYLRENVIHVEVIIMVAVIAVARKVIILDAAETSDLHLVGLGALMICLGAAYYMVKKSNHQYNRR
ncbi:MAG TPA: phosphate-starvation-inducible PsiE family protein [Methanospirillum sp.]|nr:phosphate-starvation-inducible PsiE family protein [Methanospirillum sp.]